MRQIYCKAGVTRARNLSNLSGNFLQLCVDIIIARQHIIVEACPMNWASFWPMYLQFKT